MNPKPDQVMFIDPTPRPPEASYILEITLELLHLTQRVSNLAESRLNPLLGQNRPDPDFPLHPEYYTHADYFNSLERPLKDIRSHLTYTSKLLEGLEI